VGISFQQWKVVAVTVSASDVQLPALAGELYSADPDVLRATVQAYLHEAPAEGSLPKAVIVPHAGLTSSGPVAASAYRRLNLARDQVTRVVILGTAHAAGVEGLVASSAEAFETPLGRVPVDKMALARILTKKHVQVSDSPHAGERSIEVQLPFLQELLGDFGIVPLIVGRTTTERVASVLEALFGGPETLIVISSDLSHYQPYDEAIKLDRATAEAIEGFHLQQVRSKHACGAYAIRGLLKVASKHGLKVSTVDLRNSGDTAGTRDEVVGFGAFVFEDPAA